MTYTYRFLSLLLLLGLAAPAPAPAQTLSDNLAVLAPPVGKTWVGRMTAPDGTLVDRWFQNAFGDWRAGHVVELKGK